jgi:hypothetical protein
MNLLLSLKALRDLGPQQAGLNVLYRLGLRLGSFRFSPDHGQWTTDGPLSVVHCPSRADLLAVLGSEGQRLLLHEADEIVAGRIRLFGGQPVDLKLAFERPLHHWSAYETNHALLSSFLLPHTDIKFIWEPARFGWAAVLARAYFVSGDEKYAEAFWKYFEIFTAANPAYQGPNWTSGQEAALRLLAWTFCLSLLRSADATSESRVRAMGEAIAVHAGRIPPTLLYARSQNNNHLLSEAAGLITAATVLPDHPRAKDWMLLGKKWFNAALEKQIDGYGEYSQHSTNYHRLMLQLAVWVHSLRSADFSFTPLARKNLARASHWLASLLDSESGGVPNLGANDGAYILPLTVCPFTDFRPVVQAAARAFLNYELPGGPWDEMSLWFGLARCGRSFEAGHYLGDILRGRNSWAMLRTTSFTSRPGHADLLHLDLWWRGLNVARDPGTFSYNAAPPWDNPLTASRFHNTLTVDGRDQMTRAGKFLYVDWANAFAKTEIATDESVLQRVRAHHNGYRSIGVKHERTVTVFTDERWQVRDHLGALKKKEWHVYTLHWSLPDWPWEFADLPVTIDAAARAGFEFRLQSPQGWVTLRLHYDSVAAAAQGGGARTCLVRAGETLMRTNSLTGEDVPLGLFGWHSPTYSVKAPSLSLLVTVKSTIDPDFISEFIFPK